MQPNRRFLSVGAALFIAGILVGGYLFRDVQPRSFLALSDCRGNCYRSSDLTGLLTSVGIRLAPGMTPKLEAQNEGCLAIRHPFPEHPRHFVLFPKQDIRNVGEIGEADVPYLVDCLALTQYLIARHHLRRYRLMSNGPELQQIAYLHFHLTTPEK